MADHELGYEALDVLRQIVENSSLAIIAVICPGRSFCSTGGWRG